MAENFSITVTGAPAVLRRIQQVDADTLARITDALHAGGYEMAEDARARVPVDEGAVRDSIDYRVGKAFGVGGDALLLELLASSPHAVYVHEGTRPHWPPFGPMTALAGWAARHGLTPFAAARGIATHGTRPHPFLRDAVQAGARPLLAKLARLAR